MRLQRLRTRTWPLRVAFMNLSWVPLWWMRKYVPKDQLSWTPAATFRGMAKHIRSQDETIERTFKGWRRTEEEFREYKMRHLSEQMSDDQKEFVKRVFGVEVEA